MGTMVDSKAFQSFIYGTILLNTLTMGLQADLNSDGWPTRGCPARERHLFHQR